MHEAVMCRIAKPLLFLAAFIWGTSFFIMKNTLDAVPPFLLLVFRFTTGAVLLGLFCLVMLIPVSLVTLDALKIDIPRVSASVVRMVEAGDAKVIPAELAGIAAALVVYAVCYLISVRVYQRREI